MATRPGRIMFLPRTAGMFDRELREVKDRILSLGTAPFRHVHPIGITIFSLTSGLAALYFLAAGYPVSALAFWAANRILDGLDGLVARRYGKQSDAGGFIDIIADFLIYSGIPIALALQLGTPEGFLAAAVLLGSFYLNAAVWMSGSALLEKLRNRDQNRGSTSMIMPRGLIEGFETIVFFTLMMLFPGSFQLLAYLMAALTIIGAFISFVRTLNMLQK